MSISAKDIRNVAIVGHSGEGKTTPLLGPMARKTSNSKFPKIPWSQKNSYSDHLSNILQKKNKKSIAKCLKEKKTTKKNKKKNDKAIFSALKERFTAFFLYV